MKFTNADSAASEITAHDIRAAVNAPTPLGGG